MSERDAAFARYIRELFIHRFRVAAVLAVLLVPLGWLVDCVYAPERASLLLAVRLGFSAIVLAALPLSRIPRIAARPGFLAALLALWLAAGVEVTVLLTGGVDSLYWAGFAMVIVALGLLFPWTASEMTAVCIGVLALYVLPAVAAGTSSAPTFWTHVYFLLCTVVLSATAAGLSMSLRRRDFDSRADLEWRTRELNEASANLRATVDKLEELDRLKSQFFANVSHELRTPLTVMLAMLEDALDDASVPPEMSQRIQVLHANALTLLRLINDLLELAELDAGRIRLRREPVELNALVEAAVAEFRPFAERRGIHLTTEAEGLPVIGADFAKIETIVRNLLSNAVKFTPAGGQVTVRGRRDEEWAVLEVSDTGAGIGEEEQARIFDRFTRLEGAERSGIGGSGIGLALVKEMATLHGGDVAVESAIGRGATFRVRLPRNTVAHEEGAGLQRVRTNRYALTALGVRQVEDIPASQPTVSPERILVVEDNPDLRRFLVEFLGRHFRTSEAPDGVSALEHVRSSPPDLIVADVMMPGVSGNELVRVLRSDPATAEIPCVLLTAQRGTGAAVEALGGGADDFITKPFSPRELLARVRAQLRVRDLNRQLLSSQRMALLGTLTAGLAHEVRNPMNAIVNGLPLVRRALPEGQTGDVAREMLEIVEKATWRIRRIVDDLLGFSRRGAESPSCWSPATGVQDALRLLRHRAGATRVDVVLQYAGTVPGYPDRLDQVVMNLLDNALLSTRGEGLVRVRVQQAGPGVSLTVEDDGPGIAPDVLPRIFDPFFTTREVGQGTGLGLHLSRQIAEAHGGTLEASAPPEGCAVFTLWLPEERHAHVRPA